MKQYNKLMSYFIYVPGEGMPPFMTPEQYQNYCAQMAADTYMKPFQFFVPPTMSNSQYSLNEYPTYGRAFDPPVSTLQQGLQAEMQTVGVRQRKKKEKNAEKQIESAKKNSESNLINHYFSFFNTRGKSEKTVEDCIACMQVDESGREKLLHLFYNTMQMMNTRRGRKYVNKSIFKTFFTPKELVAAIPEIRDKIQKINGVTIEQLCEVFRKCAHSFYRTYSVDSILTSKRISSAGKEEHFRKRRKMLKGIFPNEEQ